MSNELEEKKENALSAEIGSMDAWGPANISAQDMVIPKILPLHYMSEKVKEKKGEYGEFRDTLSNKLFGDLNNSFEVIPFKLEKKWIEFDMVPQKGGGSKREYKGTVPIIDNPTQEGFNDDLPLRDEDGKVERDRVMDFYVLIPEEVANGGATPYVLSFRRTSLKAGKNLATQMFVRNAAANKIPPATVMSIGGIDTENDAGSFVVQTVEPSRPSTDEEMQQAFKWFKIIGQGNHKVDESEFGETQERSADAAEESDF